MKRYEVYSVDQKLMPCWNILIGETNDLEKALEMAKTRGGEYGACIYDTHTKLIDLGFGFNIKWEEEE